MPEMHPGRRALGHIKRILEQQPRKDDDELSFATRCLAKFREELIDRARRADARPQAHDCLSRLNAVISVVMAMHFPLGNVPWGEFGKAEAWLADLVDEVEREQIAG